MEEIGSLIQVALANIGLFLFFAVGFFKLRRSRRWRSLGRWRAFVAMLYTDMYGMPLTVYLLSGWLQPRLPGVDWLSHAADRMLLAWLGWQPAHHFGLLQMLSIPAVAAGVATVVLGWRRYYRSLHENLPATDGIYSQVRHPVYCGLILIMFAVLLQCPTLATMVMFVALTGMYGRLARDDEHDALKRFGTLYGDYMARVPGFTPAWLGQGRNHGRSQAFDPGATAKRARSLREQR